MHMLCTCLSKQGTVPILRAAMCGGGLDELGHKVESNWVEPEPGRAALVLFELRPFDFEVGVGARVVWKTVVIGIGIITARCAD